MYNSRDMLRVGCLKRSALHWMVTVLQVQTLCSLNPLMCVIWEISTFKSFELFEIFSESVPQIPVTLAVSSMDGKVQCTWLFLAYSETFSADWRVFLNPQSTESDMKSRTGQEPQARFSSSRLSGNRQDFFPSICSYWSASVCHPPVNHTLYSREIHLGKIDCLNY